MPGVGGEAAWVEPRQSKTAGALRAARDGADMIAAAAPRVGRPGLAVGTTPYAALPPFSGRQMRRPSTAPRINSTKSKIYGGEGGIRTRDTLASMPHFECGAFNHSATSPVLSNPPQRIAGDTRVAPNDPNPA